MYRLFDEHGTQTHAVMVWDEDDILACLDQENIDLEISDELIQTVYEELNEDEELCYAIRERMKSILHHVANGVLPLSENKPGT